MITQDSQEIEADAERNDAKHEYCERKYVCFSMGHDSADNAGKEAKETRKEKYMQAFVVMQGSVGIGTDTERDNFENYYKPEPCGFMQRILSLPLIIRIISSIGFHSIKLP